MNAFLITDYTDRHFSWNRGNPLNALLRNEESEENHANNIVINALRKAKQEINNSTYDGLQPVIDKVIKKAEDLGVDISGTSTTIDFKDISIKDIRVCLHDDANVPFRLKGKGIKRFISLSIQLALAHHTTVNMAMKDIRNINRRVGRKIIGKCIGTTLLTKGLEFNSVCCT